MYNITSNQLLHQRI